MMYTSTPVGLVAIAMGGLLVLTPSITRAQTANALGPSQGDCIACDVCDLPDNELGHMTIDVDGLRAEGSGLHTECDYSTCSGHGHRILSSCSTLASTEFTSMKGLVDHVQATMKVADYGELKRLLSADLVDINGARQTLQVTDCQGNTIANVPLRDDQLTLLLQPGTSRRI